MTAISRSAPGKLILCGEHAVVYNRPAIAVPVDQVATSVKIFAKPLGEKGQVTVIIPQIGMESDLNSLPDSQPLKQSIAILQEYFKIDHFPSCDIRISSTIPISSGLGSSASLSVALIRAITEFIGQDVDNEETNRIAFELEKIHHGNPSGIDNTVITFARPVYFIRGEPIEFISLASPVDLVIASTGIHASTAQAVAGVRERWMNERQMYESLFDDIAKLTTKIREVLQRGEISAIGSLLTRDHELLQEMEVSCAELDSLVQVALNAGALGAKLSGGGLGGNMLALVDPSQVDAVSNALTHAGAVAVIHTVVQPTQGVL
jgi:mevalonate kinase